jgi:protein required for attachment to host cells
MKIPANAFIVVADGHRALFLRNAGNTLYPNLRVEEVLEALANPPTRDQGSDKPPRAIYGWRRSGIEQTDLHDQAKHAFAVLVSEALARNFAGNAPDALVLIAPARVLADLRRRLDEPTRRAVVLEIDKDLTKHPVHEIERHLLAA